MVRHMVLRVRDQVEGRARKILSVQRLLDRGSCRYAQAAYHGVDRHVMRDSAIATCNQFDRNQTFQVITCPACA